MKVFTSHESAPGGRCAAVTVVVAAPSRMEAVTAFRRAGFQAHKPEVMKPGDATADVALGEPGVVFWSEWADDEPEWTACR